VALGDRRPLSPCAARKVDRSARALGEDPSAPGLPFAPAGEPGVDDGLDPLGRMLDALLCAQSCACLDQILTSGCKASVGAGRAGAVEALGEVDHAARWPAAALGGD